MLINLRNAMMAGKRLSYDAELEYLESTGTQYIPFEVPFYGIDITTSHVADNNSYGIAGAWNAGARANSVKYTTVQSRGWTITNREQSGNVFSGSLTPNAPTRITVHGTSVTVNDTSYTMGVAWSPGNNVYKFALFGCYNRGENVDPLSGRIYHCSLYDVNGVLVRDFIPVRKGTVGYLYDRVSGKLFGNAGTGDFVLGPDVVPVEYIESHGTEYIDTGVVGGSSSKVEIVASSSNTSANFALLGARDSGAYLNSFTVWQCANNRPRFDFTASTADVVWAASGSWNTSGYNSITKDGPLNTLNGIPCTSNTEKTFSCNFPFYLFAVNTKGTNVSNFVGRMKTCRVLSDSIPIRSFLPVRVGTDATSWEGAMMDVLTRRIYRNNGTGAFAYGNDLKYPIPAE